MDYTGYRQALIHLAWFRDDTIRHLLFGMVELRPNEFPDAVGCPTKEFRIGNKGRQYLHYRRFVPAAADAIDWYEAAAGGTLILPGDPNQPTPGDGAKLEGGPFVQEPPWPHLATSKELVFAPDWMQDSRTHFLLPQHVLPPEISKSIRTDRNQTMLKEWLNFDIVNAYPEYQGAICLVAPNPLFRSIERTHVEQATPESAETMAYKLVARQGQRLDGLRLEVVNERLGGGRMTPLVHEFGDDAIAIFDFPAEIHLEGLAITHPKHGLLNWHGPLPLARVIHFRGEMHSRQKEIEVPADGRRRSEYEYEVDEVVDAGETVVGEDLKNLPVLSRLTEAESRRNRRQAAIDYDQQWFHRAPSEAAQYVRQIIGRARDRVLIVDPYFAGRELLAFGHAIRRPGVNLRILTSTQGLKGSGCDNPNVDLGSQLLQTLNHTFRTYSTKPEIRILTGSPPGVHDRFLIVDGNVWFSGNSLHTIGERAGMIIKLPDPEPVVALLKNIWDEAPALSDWLSGRRTTS